MFILQETRQTVEAEHDLPPPRHLVDPLQGMAGWGVPVRPCAARKGGPGMAQRPPRCSAAESVVMALSRKWIFCNHLLPMSQEEKRPSTYCTQRNPTQLEIPETGIQQTAGVSKWGTTGIMEERGETKESVINVVLDMLRGVVSCVYFW